MHLQLEPTGSFFKMEAVPTADDRAGEQISSNVQVPHLEAAAAASSSVAMEEDRSGDGGEGFGHVGSLSANRCVVV